VEGLVSGPHGSVRIVVVSGKGEHLLGA
jgi:hypothetical protein